MAVRILIRRHFKEGRTAQALRMLNELRREAMKQPGYISGETLVNHYDPRSITVVSTWRELDDWIRWEESDRREAIESRFEDLLEQKASFEVYELGWPPES